MALYLQTKAEGIEILQQIRGGVTSDGVSLRDAVQMARNSAREQDPTERTHTLRVLTPRPYVANCGGAV